MNNTTDESTSTPNELVPKAPSYNDLFNTVIELTERLQKLESTADSQIIRPQPSKLDAVP
jgi:hypothetical protein